MGAEQAELATRRPDTPLRFLWLEITGRCNLNCVHCYADSGPSGQPDLVGTARWLSVLAEAADLGVRQVQFIGGEPTLHPDFAKLVETARDLGLEVEVYSNLTHISPALWDLFSARRVSIATSFYSQHKKAHDAVTQGRGSQARTLSNIRTALDRGLQVRVGIVDVYDDQDVQGTVRMLQDIGVRHIRVDRSRGVGRAGAQAGQPSAAELCGHCASGRLAIDPLGHAYPCVFSRWLPVGNARETSLAEIRSSMALASVRADLIREFRLRRPEEDDPDPCDPDGGDGGGGDECTPTTGPCSPDTPDCTPTTEPLCQPVTTPVCDPDAPECSPLLEGCDPDREGCAPETTPCTPNHPPCAPFTPCQPDLPCPPVRK